MLPLQWLHVQDLQHFTIAEAEADRHECNDEVVEYRYTITGIAGFNIPLDALLFISEMISAYNLTGA